MFVECIGQLAGFFFAAPGIGFIVMAARGLGVIVVEPEVASVPDTPLIVIEVASVDVQDSVTD